MEERLTILRQQCASAVEDFEQSLALDFSSLKPELSDLLRNGQTQKFEFTVEISWKTLKEFIFQIHGFDLLSPKSVIKKFFELGYLNYEELERFLRALDIRNSFSHIYNREFFLELYNQILPYKGFFSQILKKIT